MAAETATVEVEHGRLRGALDRGIASFKGVPYAADTGGRHRFMAPRPVAAWSGVRDALQLGDRCVQERETFADTPAFSWYGQAEPFSENCCVLNIFTPGLEPAARRPVMFYIHGGGTVTGGGGGAVLDGSQLARFGDVVVVTVNHRLGVLGYTNLGHLDAEGFGDAANAGQLDLVAALGWVQRNIAVFGGDPGNVTLFGQSGGGSKIMVLMGMPAAKGLFHRAINMSGTSGLAVAEAASTQPYVDALLKSLDVGPGDLRQLQALPADALLQARATALAATRGEGARPVLDGRHVLWQAMSPQALALHASVPMMFGTADTEASFYLRGDRRNFQLTEHQVKARLQAQFGIDAAQADALMAAYRPDDPGRTPSEVLMALASDTMFRVPILRAALAKANAKQTPVYVYNFVWRAPVEGGVWRSPHTIDIPFAFGNTDRAQSMTGTGPEPLAVSHHLMSAFVAFARRGDPNNPQLPHWPAYDAASRATMLIDTHCRSIDDFHGADRIAGSTLRMDPFDRQALFRYVD